MAFNSTPPRVEYTASTGQTVFTYQFKAYEDSDIILYLTPVGNIPDDVADILTLTADYTVAITGDIGGSITLTAPATSGDAITILRSLPIDRDTDYQTNGDLLAETLDGDQDYQTYLIADSEASKERVMTLAQNSQSVSNVMPAPSGDDYIKWNTAGTALENDTTIPASVQIAVDAAAAALISETNAANSAASSAADVVLTNADVVLTNADVVLTNADVLLTNADVVLTHADVVLTNADAAQTALDKIATNADVVLTNADVVLTNADVVLTHADVLLTNADVLLTAADVTATNADVVLTNADVVLTGADLALTNADVTLTHADAVSTSADAAAAQVSAEQAATSGNVYVDTTAGLAATLDTEYFSVAGLDETYMTLYLNDGGVAVFQNEIYSKAKVDSLTNAYIISGSIPETILDGMTWSDSFTNSTKLRVVDHWEFSFTSTLTPELGYSMSDFNIVTGLRKIYNAGTGASKDADMYSGKGVFLDGIDQSAPIPITYSSGVELHVAMDAAENSGDETTVYTVNSVNSFDLAVTVAGTGNKKPSFGSPSTIISYGKVATISFNAVVNSGEPVITSAALGFIGGTINYTVMNGLNVIRALSDGTVNSILTFDGTKLFSISVTNYSVNEIVYLDKSMIRYNLVDKAHEARTSDGSLTSAFIASDTFDGTSTDSYLTSNSTIDNVDNRLRITATSAFGYSYKVYPAEIGKTYTVSFLTALGTSTTMLAKVGTNATNNQYLRMDTAGQSEVTFESISTSIYVTAYSVDSGGTAFLDNVLIDEVTPIDIIDSQTESFSNHAQLNSIAIDSDLTYLDANPEAIADLWFATKLHPDLSFNKTNIISYHMANEGIVSAEKIYDVTDQTWATFVSVLNYGTVSPTNPVRFNYNNINDGLQDFLVEKDVSERTTGMATVGTIIGHATDGRKLVLPKDVPLDFFPLKDVDSIAGSGTALTVTYVDTTTEEI